MKFFFQNNMVIFRNGILIIICLIHFTARGNIVFPADSIRYYLDKLDNSRSHDNQLILNIISLLSRSSLNDLQLNKADSIIENYHSKLSNEYYYALRYKLNVKLVEANQQNKAYERILKDITF